MGKANDHLQGVHKVGVLQPINGLQTFSFTAFFAPYFWRR